jgi:hypothetical protein
MKIYAYIPMKRKSILLTSSKLVPFLKNNFTGVSFQSANEKNRRKFIKARFAQNCLPDVKNITDFHKQLCK